jgi:hypothetical protein
MDDATQGGQISFITMSRENEFSLSRPNKETCMYTVERRPIFSGAVNHNSTIRHLYASC